MDLGKYKEGMELVSSSEENGLLTQEFYNPTHHVKYNRVAWGGVISKGDELDIVKELCSSSTRFLSKVLPNTVKIEMDDFHMESMYFEDEDTVWNSRMTLQPLLSKLGLEKRLTVKNLMLNKEDYYKAIDELTTNSEYVNTVKEVYKNYLDKEL